MALTWFTRKHPRRSQPNKVKSSTKIKLKKIF